MWWKELPRNICPLIKSTFGSVIEKKCFVEPFTSGKACPHFDIVDMIIAEATCDGKKKMYELLPELIENTGGIIVVEESCTGTRAFWDLVSETYLNIPCACMFPNEQRIKHILELVEKFNAVLS